MKCKDIMSKIPKRLYATDSVQEAATIMATYHVGFLPVCNDHEKVVGALTDRDIVLRVVARGGSLQNQVGTVMTNELVCCQATDDIEKAERLMRDHDITRIACTDIKGNLVGVINKHKLHHNDTAGAASHVLQGTQGRRANLQNA
jgi:CBS domain-containing protein